MTYILRSHLTTHSSGRGVSLPFVVNEWFRLIDCSLECISAVVLRDVVAGSSLSEKSIEFVTYLWLGGMPGAVDLNPQSTFLPRSTRRYYAVFIDVSAWSSFPEGGNDFSTNLNLAANPNMPVASTSGFEPEPKFDQDFRSLQSVRNHWLKRMTNCQIISLLVVQA